MTLLQLPKRGAEAIVEYALENCTEPIALDWRWSPENGLLQRFVNDSKGKLLISDNSVVQTQFTLTATSISGKFELTTENRLRIPISMGAKATAPIDWLPPKSPQELVRGKNQTAINVENEIDALWQAVNLERGDDKWADKNESKFPLASWIASSSDTHQSRWRRIGHLLDPNWASIASYSTFDDEDISELAIFQEEALDELLNRIRTNPLVVNNLDLENPAVATAILLSGEWFEQTIDVIDSWLENPIRTDEVLTKNWDSKNINKLSKASPHHSLLLENITLSRSQMLAIMEDVNYSLWKHKAKTWLISCLSSNVGRTALTELDLPWPVILVDSEISSEDLNLIYHMPEGGGKDSLLDTIEGIEAAELGKTPPMGRTHPFAGWLFQDTIPSIPMDCHWNVDIHIALHRRIQG